MARKRKFPVTRQEIKRILVPMDYSDSSLTALNEAIFLARNCGATITGLHVVSIYPEHLSDLTGPIKKRLYQDAKKVMNKAKMISAQNGIVFKGKIVYGDAKSDISNFAARNKYDLIVMGSRGLTRVKEFFLGSVSNSVLHKSRVPVLIVK